MDKKVLNELELEQLKKFIMSRGFKDSGTIIEVLDHLACKVEEIVTNEPAMVLEEATKKAHASFGVRGFRDIAAAYEEWLRKKYTSVYLQEIKASFKHPVHLLALTAIGVLCYQSFRWLALNDHRHVLNMLDFSLLTFLFTIALDMILLARIPEKSRHNLIIQFALSPDNFSWLPYFFIIMTSGSTNKGAGLVVSLVIHVLIVIFGILNFKGRFKALDIAKEEYYAQKGLV